MKNVSLSVVAALAFIAAPAFAADVPVKAGKAAPPPPPAPAWDVSFGGVVMSDYNFRGVSQSNRGVSGGAYIEPSYTTPFGTLYAGIGVLAINWPSGAGYGFTDPASEVDYYGGWRKEWGPLSVDLGYIYYYYPKEIFNGATGNSDFWEIYGKVSYAITPALSVGGNVFYTDDLLNYSETFAAAGIVADAEATYGSITAEWTLPWNWNGVGASVSGEYGHWWIDDTGYILAGFLDPSYSYWNVGIAFTYKALTLDLRYHGTDQNVADCNSFLLVAAGNFSSNWCDERFIASAKFDTSLSALN